MANIAVMLEETLAALAVQPGGSYIDGTLGHAGHAAEVLRRAGPEGRLLGMDRDQEALAHAAVQLQELPGVKVLAHGNHGALSKVACAHGFGEVDGVLLDLGVNSDQLDVPVRGFSFMRDGPLDMRMDVSRGETAADLVARMDADELAALFRELGEEPRAWAIAQAIVRERMRAPIVTTARLAEVVAAASGWQGGRR